MDTIPVSCQFAGNVTLRDQPPEISRRDLEIYHRFDGSNHLRLAQRYGLAARQVNTIVKRVGEVECHRRQTGLF